MASTEGKPPSAVVPVACTEQPDSGPELWSGKNGSATRQDWESSNRNIARALNRIGASRRKGMATITYADLLAMSPGFMSGVNFWDGLFFNNDAAPRRAVPPPSVSFCFDDSGREDLVVLEYTVGPNPVVVVASPGYTLTVLPRTGAMLKSLDTPLQIAAIRKLAEQLFTPWFAKQPWQTRPPSSADDGVAFAYMTDPSQWPFTVRSFQLRIDAGVWEGQVYFLFYRAMRGQSLAPNPRFFEHFADEARRERDATHVHP